MLELGVHAKSPAAITAALKKIREMIMTGAAPKDTPVHIVLEPGVYKETVRYNLSNPLVLESVPGSRAKNVVIQAENCEAFHAGLENRAVFALGQSATNVVLRNFTIVNTHTKAVMEGTAAPDAAEAFVWNNTTGTLLAEGMSFEGQQNTLCVKGFSWFKGCSISGDTDVIYGDADTALFEDCAITLREDNRGDCDGYAIKSTALANRPGFVFMNCRFMGEKRRSGSLYVFRTEGRGGPATPKGWDSAALIQCFVSEHYNPEFGWDDDMNLSVYPRGNARTGWREYGTRIVAKNGSVSEADTTRRNIKSYTLTDEDYFKGYASRYLVLRGTPFAPLVD